MWKCSYKQYSKDFKEGTVALEKFAYSASQGEGLVVTRYRMMKIMAQFQLKNVK